MDLECHRVHAREALTGLVQTVAESRRVPAVVFIEVQRKTMSLNTQNLPVRRNADGASVHIRIDEEPIFVGASVIAILQLRRGDHRLRRVVVRRDEVHWISLAPADGNGELIGIRSRGSIPRVITRSVRTASDEEEGKCDERYGAQNARMSFHFFSFFPDLALDRL